MRRHCAVLDPGDTGDTATVMSAAPTWSRSQPATSSGSGSSTGPVWGTSGSSATRTSAPYPAKLPTVPVAADGSTAATTTQRAQPCANARAASKHAVRSGAVSPAAPAATSGTRIGGCGTTATRTITAAG